MDNRYAFNGKEQDDEGEWGEGQTVYEYGARTYNPMLARFIRVDPIARKFSHLSPYNYADNEPIAHIDLHGLQKQITITQVGRNSEGRYTTTFTIERPPEGVSNHYWNTYAPEISMGDGTLVLRHFLDDDFYEAGTVQQLDYYPAWYDDIVTDFRNLKDGIGDLIERWTPETSTDPAAYHGGNGSQPTGIEQLTPDGRLSNGTLQLPRAEQGSTSIIELDGFAGKDGGGGLGDAVRAVKIAYPLFYTAKSVEALDETLQRVYGRSPSGDTIRNQHSYWSGRFSPEEYKQRLQEVDSTKQATGGNNKEEQTNQEPDDTSQGG